MNEEETKAFIELIDSIKELRLRKSADYGNSWKIWGLEGVVWQIKSKFIRMSNLLQTKKDPANEPLRDTFLDMANYCIMAVQLIDQKEVEGDMSKLLTITKIDK